MSRIYLIRHAQASISSDVYDRLSPLGLRQATILADYFRRVNMKFDAVYSGEMERQKDTAKPVMAALFGDESDVLRIAPEFDEYDAHSIIRHQIQEMTSEDPAVAEAASKLTTDGRSLSLVFKRAMLRWVRGERNIPGVETWQEFVQRVDLGIERVIQENGPKKTVAVFTSGGAICVSMRKALKLSDEQTILLPLQTINTGISLFHFSEGSFTLSYFNSIAHLELLNERKLITYR
jgi:broad specificity phosphatase PhoE